MEYKPPPPPGAARASRDRFTKIRKEKPSREEVLDIIRKNTPEQKKPAKKIARRKDVDL